MLSEPEQNQKADSIDFLETRLVETLVWLCSIWLFKNCNILLIKKLNWKLCYELRSFSSYNIPPGTRLKKIAHYICCPVPFRGNILITNSVPSYLMFTEWMSKIHLFVLVLVLPVVRFPEQLDLYLQDLLGRIRRTLYLVIVQNLGATLRVVLKLTLCSKPIIITKNLLYLLRRVLSFLLRIWFSI